MGMGVFQAFCGVLDWSKGVGLDSFTATIHMNDFSHAQFVHFHGSNAVLSGREYTEGIWHSR